jgi:1,4-dihydroxy-6-naphthoate synthase
LAAPHRLRFGFSPCPNDTFAFWAAVRGAVPSPGLEFEAVLADIEALNRRALGNGEAPLAITKLSLPALAAVSHRYAVLPAGAALGFGCGPLVVRRGEDDGLATLLHLRGRRVAIPGRHTTAFLLFATFAGQDCAFVETRFDQVMPMVARGECDAGLIIHEGRFTYHQHGLVALADLGQLWERATSLPLPLGLIALRRDLGRELHERVGSALRDSVAFARATPDAPRDYVRAHCQELDDAVCSRHIALYVNDFTVDLGERGRAAVDGLLARGRAAGLLPAGPSPWWGGAEGTA